jgi:hypothetical protein
LEDTTAQTLQGHFGIFPGRKKGDVQIEDESRMAHLAEEDHFCRQDLIGHLEHIQAVGHKPDEALEQLVREISFTHLNRFCAYKVMEARGLIREAVNRGAKSQGFFFYLADHPEDERLHNSGKKELAYRHFLDWVGGTLSEEVGVLFNPKDPANRIYPPQRVMEEVLALINDEELKDIWSQDETIGWVYQYFTPKELRDKARKESQAPRNSYELAFRNQFFTPRYVVVFLTDNTLGRIWYEMRKGKTILKDRCKYLLRRPTEVFLTEGEQPPAEPKHTHEELSQEELLKQTVYVPHRPKKDPRELKVLDPACGSGHFLLYCFDLLWVIYEEAYDDPDLGAALRKDYPAIEDLRSAVPGLILKYNLHGIDIDLRATQIAALALWLRCQRAYQELGLKNGERPKITRSNIVCAEPMPGETDLLREFTASLQPKILGQLVEVVFEKMKLAGEAGSLLRIENEIRDAATAARGEYLKELRWRKEEAGYLPGMALPKERTAYDFSDMTDSQFLDRAEEEIVEALRRYAENAVNGGVYKRRLFADDTARGFAFVDICRERFDAVLMNPPFGDPAVKTREYLTGQYPEGSHDICAAFVLGFAKRLAPKGKLGAITTRLALFIQTFTAWRQLLLDNHHFETVADLGYGVLDAMVETAMYTIGQEPQLDIRDIAFIGLLNSASKESTLDKCLRDTKVDWRQSISFEGVPGQPLAYWVPDSLLIRFKALASFNKMSGGIRQGIATGDDFRFLRLRWELPEIHVFNKIANEPENVSPCWVPLSKGGEYALWWDDIHLALNWQNNGSDVRNFYDERGRLRSRPQNIESFFVEGATFAYRTTSAFGLRYMPPGCAFSVGGWGVFPPESYSLFETLAVYNTRIARYFMEVLLGQGDASASGTAARNHGAAAVGGIPWPATHLDSRIQDAVPQLVELWARLNTDETCSNFVVTDCLAEPSGSLHEAAEKSWSKRCELWRRVAALHASVENEVTKAYSLSSFEIESIAAEEGRSLSEYTSGDIDHRILADLFSSSVESLTDKARQVLGARRYVVKKAFFVDRVIDLACHMHQLVPDSVIEAAEKIDVGKIGYLFDVTSELLSWIVGSIYGRWDVTYGIGNGKPTEVPSVIGNLSKYPPGFLLNNTGSPAREEDLASNYPLRIDWDGIVVDDPEHEADIIHRCRECLEVIWGHRSETIEREICEILGVQELRDYFRKPGNGGFWVDHVKRYSKSRRKAPIYWYLRSGKGNYGLWLYYHRLDKDFLFKALLNYVEPKIRLEEDRLNSLRSRKEAVGTSGREAKQVEKDIDRQEQFLSELHDFRDKLRRAADLNLVPDLNDGAVLNIAPLWELVPWKEAQEYWEELIEGKYEWSSIGKQLHEKDPVRK